MSLEIDRIVVIHDFSETEGGAGAVALQSIEQFHSMGLPVTFITGEGERDDLEALGIDLVCLNSKALLKTFPINAALSGYSNSAAKSMISNWIDEHDTDRTFYFVHNWSQILSPSIFGPLQRVAARCVIVCHDFFNVCPNGSFTHFSRSEPCALKPLSVQCLGSQCDRRNSLHKYWRFLRQKHLRSIVKFETSDFTFTFLHERMRDMFFRNGMNVKKSHVIPNPIDAWRDTRIAAEENSGFLFVGRVGSDKGADFAVEAANRSGLPLTVIGDGELVNDKSSNGTDAEFVGWKTKAEIADYARNARALIVPSRVIEPFGLVIFEAAMSGLPVIVSDRAYVAKDVEREGFGRVFHLNDGSDGLARLMQEIAEDDELVRRMSEIGFETASKFCHTPESFAQACLDILPQSANHPSH